MAVPTSARDRQLGFDPAVPLPKVTEVVDRRWFLPDVARGQRVVHLGCVDDRLALTRANSGALLHEQLAKVAGSLVGVDISIEGLEVLAEIVPGTYVCGDVEVMDELPLPDECDVVIAGEIIEHLGSPGRFLDALGRYLARTGATGWLTTPNAYDWANAMRFGLLRREHTHPDHRHLYSPATLKCSLDAAGLELVSLRVHRWQRGRDSIGARARDLIDGAVLRVNPLLGPGLIAEVRSTSVR